jgi:hypothetical protein
MKEERISLVTAKILKEKNFTEEVYGSYTEYIKSHKSDNPSFNYRKGEIEISGDYFTNNGHCDFSNKNYIMYAAPTQSFLQRWLREEHGIVIGIHLQLHTDETKTIRLEKEKYYSWIVNLRDREAYNSFEDCDSYEEAVEIGLLEALNIITL